MDSKVACLQRIALRDGISRICQNFTRMSFYLFGTYEDFKLFNFTSYFSLTKHMFSRNVFSLKIYMDKSQCSFKQCNEIAFHKTISHKAPNIGLKGRYNSLTHKYTCIKKKKHLLIIIIIKKTENVSARKLRKQITFY